jgi:hypothetical protein
MLSNFFSILFHHEAVFPRAQRKVQPNFFLSSFSLSLFKLKEKRRERILKIFKTMMMMIYLLSGDYKLSWTLMTSFSTFFLGKGKLRNSTSKRIVWKNKEKAWKGKSLVFASTPSFAKRIQLVFLSQVIHCFSHPSN